MNLEVWPSSLNGPAGMGQPCPAEGWSTEAASGIEYRSCSWTGGLGHVGILAREAKNGETGLHLGSSRASGRIPRSTRAMFADPGLR